MDDALDFLPRLGEDVSFKILESLKNPSELIHASCVSRSWHQFVVRNGLCKQMCLKKFPQLSEVDHVKEPSSCEKVIAEAGPSNSLHWENLQREHRVFAFLAHCCAKPIISECVAAAISASSTDNYPEESIENTLEKRDRVGRLASYWSSKGSKDPSAPEKLIYRLAGDLCIVTEICIQPFQAYFHEGYPIYSANSVRFRMGHAKGSMDILEYQMDQEGNERTDEKFTWTYTSPKFSMSQENCLQTFKLPEPVLCIGGVLLIELLGRVQRQEIDGLFYVCVTHVKVLGRPLSPAFGVRMLEPEGKFELRVHRYDPEVLKETRNALDATVMQRRILYMLQANLIGVNYMLGEDQNDEEQDEPDDEEEW
ncbi:hypothetical protein SAY87_015067 [Trapa incisa]|uniref:F-box domain-containing protein n=1 Tax=Trapa incisa TaxID=236973 RepID=A0AAN7GL26_9MYRT|nr:hypothetical protein SAY87_015067 [Trapa incisa]